MHLNGNARGVLIGGLLAGTLDIAFAFAYCGYLGVSPARILRSVASGLVGEAARTGGVPLAAFGLSLHLFISVAAAAVFYLASRRVSWLVRHPYVSGVAFGICVYFVMGYVVVPLSAFPYKQASAGAAAVSVPVLLAHMFLFGLPIALCVRRWSSIPRL
jgi:hypothetical protein